MGKLRQESGNRGWKPPTSTNRITSVMAKQKHQANMAQWPITPSQAPTWTTKEKATQVDTSCSRRKRPSLDVSARGEPTMVGEPRPEEVVVVVTVVRVTVTGMAEPSCYTPSWEGGSGRGIEQILVLILSRSADSSWGSCGECW